MNTIYQNDTEIAAEQQRFITKVYAWVSFALIITAAVAKYTVSSEFLLQMIFGNRYGFIGLIILEFILVARLIRIVNRISAVMTTALFLLYSAINGLTLSVVFLNYTSGSIASTFYVTAATFAVMSAYGYFTKSDLTKWGNLLFMGLVGVIIASVVNFFLNSTMLYWITTYIGIMIFVGLIAYDTQKIKNINVIGNEGTQEDRKEAILGALVLYLDFINLFLMLLRVLGRRK